MSVRRSVLALVYFSVPSEAKRVQPLELPQVPAHAAVPGVSSAGVVERSCNCVVRVMTREGEGDGCGG